MDAVIEELLARKQELQNMMIEKMCSDNLKLRMLADSMVESATNIKGQGYFQFINARETFFNSLQNMHEDYVEMNRRLL